MQTIYPAAGKPTSPSLALSLRCRLSFLENAVYAKGRRFPHRRAGNRPEAAVKRKEQIQQMTTTEGLAFVRASLFTESGGSTGDMAHHSGRSYSGTARLVESSKLAMGA